MTDVMASFISYQINKIKWKPEGPEEPEYFVTGSADEENNSLILWYHPINEGDCKLFPRKEVTLPHAGDVTDLKFLSPRNFIVSSSLGGLILMDVTHSEMQPIHVWTKLHYFKNKEAAPCTAVATFERDVATVGEDGRIVLLTVTEQHPVRTFDNADSSSLRCASFVTHSELITANMRGQLKMWDLRRPTDDEALISSFMLPTAAEGGITAATTCLAHHPNQRHYMLAGSENGTVSMWDLRKTTYPLQTVNAHDSPVSELLFHPESTENLFTCSFGGQLWHWNNARNMQDNSSNDYIGWLMNETTQHKINISSLISTNGKPIHSMDIIKTRLICGGVSESVNLLKNCVV